MCQKQCSASPQGKSSSSIQLGTLLHVGRTWVRLILALTPAWNQCHDFTSLGHWDVSGRSASAVSLLQTHKGRHEWPWEERRGKASVAMQDGSSSSKVNVHRSVQRYEPIWELNVLKTPSIHWLSVKHIWSSGMRLLSGMARSQELCMSLQRAWEANPCSVLVSWLPPGLGYLPARRSRARALRLFNTTSHHVLGEWSGAVVFQFCWGVWSGGARFHVVSNCAWNDPYTYKYSFMLLTYVIFHGNNALQSSGMVRVS